MGHTHTHTKIQCHEKKKTCENVHFCAQTTQSSEASSSANQRQTDQSKITKQITKKLSFRRDLQVCENTLYHKKQTQTSLKWRVIKQLRRLESAEDLHPSARPPITHPSVRLIGSRWNHRVTFPEKLDHDWACLLLLFLLLFSQFSVLKILKTKG